MLAFSAPLKCLFNYLVYRFQLKLKREAYDFHICFKYSLPLDATAAQIGYTVFVAASLIFLRS